MIHLNGHSGCTVVLLDDKTVRKTSHSPQYDDRLCCQMEKQIRFSNPNIKSPKVLSHGISSNGRFFYDMEYIQGRNLCDVFRTESSFYCKNIIERLLCIHDGNDHTIDISLMLESKIMTLGGEKDLSIIQSCDWKVPAGYCHGDLTFENIIISDNGIYLIDFLDSFVDCPIIDEAKLLQDAFCYWSFRDGYVPKRKLISVCEMFDTKRHYCILLVHLMRILPYASQSTKENVLWMMDSVRTKINQF